VCIIRRSDLLDQYTNLIHLQASSDIEAVNSLWKGLGYYSRAARLLAGAQKVVKKFKGRLPADAKGLEEHIPGIGRYSAGAIASIAYGECAPVVSLFPIYGINLIPTYVYFSSGMVTV
jgi:adenine-specific DNA glycosylase